MPVWTAFGVKSRINVASRVGAGAATDAVFAAGLAEVAEDAPAPQPAERAARAARTQAETARARITPRISRARIGAPWRRGGRFVESGGVSVDQPIADRAPSLFAGGEAICRLTTMRRAAIFMADAARRRVRAIGSYGIAFEQLSGIRPTLVNTPIAQRALLEDKVVVVSERIEDAVPPEYAKLLGITTLVCTPLSAGGYAYGVICADRGGGTFELSDGERHLLWTLGKTAALVAAARNVTRQQERMRRLGERLDLAREIHESVLQRLFGVSLALGAEQPLDRDERERWRMQMQGVLIDLRRALERPLAPLAPETGTTLAAELDRVRKSPGMVVEVDWRG